MARLSGLGKFFDPGLELGGVPGSDGQERDYTVPLPSAELGLWCQMVAEATGRLSAASTEEEIREVAERLEHLPDLPGDKGKTITLPQRVLGAAYDEMVSDGVAHPYIQHCGATAFNWIVAGEEAARRYWESGGAGAGDPGPANRAERRQAARKGASSRTMSTAGASTTRSRDSGSGTTSRKSSGAKASRGATSSNTGT